MFHYNKFGTKIAIKKKGKTIYKEEFLTTIFVLLLQSIYNFGNRSILKSFL